jgi:hypothetical protein
MSEYKLIYRFVLDDDSELILNDKQIDELYAGLVSVINHCAGIRIAKAISGAEKS